MEGLWWSWVRMAWGKALSKEPEKACGAPGKVVSLYFLCFRLRLGQKQVHTLKVNSKQFVRPVFESWVWGVLPAFQAVMSVQLPKLWSKDTA